MLLFKSHSVEDVLLSDNVQICTLLILLQQYLELLPDSSLLQLGRDLVLRQVQT